MEEKNEISAQEKLLNEITAQKKLLKTIIGKGLKFSVSYTVKVRKKGIRGIFQKKVKELRHEEFVMKEPTLAVLDRASEVWLRMNTEDNGKEGGDTTMAGFKAARDHARDMAECLAILTLGEDYYAVEGGAEKERKRMTELFYRTVKPSQTKDIASFINIVSNLTVFTNSMRMMKTAITTNPATRIEESVE